MAFNPGYKPLKIAHMHGDIHVHTEEPMKKIPYMRGDGKDTFSLKEANDPKYGPKKIATVKKSKPLAEIPSVKHAPSQQVAGQRQNAKLGNGAKKNG